MGTVWPVEGYVTMPLPSEQITDAVKAAPPITITGMTIVGIQVQDWLLILTLVYTILQILIIVRRFMLNRRVTDTTCVKDCSNRRKYSGD